MLIILTKNLICVIIAAINSKKQTKKEKMEKNKNREEQNKITSSPWDILTEQDNSDEAIMHRIKSEVVGDKFDFRNMDYDEFSNKMKMINNLARGGDVNELVNGDEFDAPDNMLINGYFGIKKEARETAYKDLFESVQQLPADEGASLMFYGINKIHGFRDGNGRTSRIMSDLVYNDGELSGENLIGHGGDISQNSGSNLNQYKVDYGIWDRVADAYLDEILGTDKVKRKFTYNEDACDDEDKLPVRSRNGEPQLEDDYNYALYINNPKDWSGEDRVEFNGSLGDYGKEEKQRIEDLQSGIKFAKLQIIEDLFVHPDWYDKYGIKKEDGTYEWIYGKDRLMKCSDFNKNQE